MNKTVLQIPVSKTLRIKAENVAFDCGFSSLQEIVRVFMAKLAKGAIDISFQETIDLSPKASRRYQKIDEDFSRGKNVFFAESVSELKNKLSK